VLARSCADALRETVAGVILHGSLTLGDYLPGRSDVDLLVVVDPPGRVDLRVVTRQVAGAPTPAPPMEAYIEITPTSGSELYVERRHPGERDLVVEFSISGTALGEQGGLPLGSRDLDGFRHPGIRVGARAAEVIERAQYVVMPVIGERELERQEVGAPAVVLHARSLGGGLVGRGVHEIAQDLPADGGSPSSSQSITLIAAG
jgi:Nucleotidyltransferase domain